jgi:hypothetical protein
LSCRFSNAYIVAYLSDTPATVYGNSATNAVILDQNFPNPATGITMIGYELPKDSYASLTLFDALGREVRTLETAALHSAGRHQVNFDGSQLPTGTYYYLLRASEVQLVRSLQIVH